MILLYGAYGYTGELVARRAAAHGLKVVLGGRDPRRLQALGAELSSETRAFDLREPSKLLSQLQGVRAVLNCAGPFSRTALPLAQACLRARAHYLDITGEIDVFESLAALHAEAVTAGITLLPGAGFDVVPSDCLAAHVASKVPRAERLVLAFQTSSRASRGTATTALENAGSGGRMRKDGRIVRVPLAHRKLSVDMGHGRRSAVAIPWGDVATAFHSTGIGTIETFVVLPATVRLTVKAAAALTWGPLRSLIERRIRKGPPGPSSKRRAQGWSVLWAEASASDGRSARARLRAPEPYELTSWTALELARRANEGELPVGFQTPSRACGADFIRLFPRVERQDLA